MLKSSIWPIDRTLSGAATPGQSRPRINGNKGVLSISQSSGITVAAWSYCLMSNSGHWLGDFLPLCRDAVGVFYSPGRLDCPGLSWPGSNDNEKILLRAQRHEPYNQMQFCVIFMTLTEVRWEALSPCIGAISVFCSLSRLGYWQKSSKVEEFLTKKGLYYSKNKFKYKISQLVGAIEYTDCTSAKG